MIEHTIVVSSSLRSFFVEFFVFFPFLLDLFSYQRSLPFLSLEWPPPGAPFPECTLFLLPLVNLRRIIYPDLTLPTQLAPGIHISEHCQGGRPHAECFSCFFIPGGRYYYSPFINDKTEPLRDEMTCPSSQS